MGDCLELVPLRFVFAAQEEIRFPAGKAGNTLRGALGTILRPVERAGMGGPSGWRAGPRGFVFRARHLDGRRVEAGEEFSFDVHLFDVAAVDGLVEAFGKLEALGARRGRVEFRRVTGRPLRLELEGTEAVNRLRVRFVTPTELKSGERVVERPEFGILAVRVRDRISALRERYGPGPLWIDFRGFGERASRVEMTRCAVEWREVERRSSRTGQRHSIGGFVGEAEYEGELREFVPYLRAAEWTGVGRHTVWGNGEIAVDVQK